MAAEDGRPGGTRGERYDSIRAMAVLELELGVLRARLAELGREDGSEALYVVAYLERVVARREARLRDLTARRAPGYPRCRHR